MKRIHAFVSGKVQGVGFRSATQQKARKLGVSGWVRNCDDGRVEVVAEGNREQLFKMEGFLKEGSWIARVKDVEIEEEEPEGLEDFKVKR
ncbi:MAG: acylphosphatase [Candidatus Nanosalina sp.]